MANVSVYAKLVSIEVHMVDGTHSYDTIAVTNGNAVAFSMESDSFAVVKCKA